MMQQVHTTVARAGVPQVIVPHWGDPFYWARRVRRLGLGPTPTPRALLSRRALRRWLLEVHHQPRFAAAAAAPCSRLSPPQRILDAVHAIERAARPTPSA